MEHLVNPDASVLTVTLLHPDRNTCWYRSGTAKLLSDGWMRKMRKPRVKTKFRVKINFSLLEKQFYAAWMQSIVEMQNKAVKAQQICLR